MNYKVLRSATWTAHALRRQTQSRSLKPTESWSAWPGRPLGGGNKKGNHGRSDWKGTRAGWVHRTIFQNVLGLHIKGDLVPALQQIYQLRGQHLQLVNSANITLLAKKDDPMAAIDYGPINLMHSVAKLVSKIMANRLAPVLPSLVSPCQSASSRDEASKTISITSNGRLTTSTRPKHLCYCSNLTWPKPLTVSNGTIYWRSWKSWVLVSTGVTFYRSCGILLSHVSYSMVFLDNQSSIDVVSVKVIPFHLCCSYWTWTLYNALWTEQHKLNYSIRSGLTQSNSEQAYMLMILHYLSDRC